MTMMHKLHRIVLNCVALHGYAESMNRFNFELDQLEYFWFV